MTTVEFRFHNGSRQAILKPSTEQDKQLLNLWRGERGSVIAVLPTSDATVAIECRDADPHPAEEASIRDETSRFLDSEDAQK